MTSVLRYLTNDLARMNVENDVRWVRMGGIKGQLLMAVAKVGAENTGSDGYQRSNKEGGGRKAYGYSLNDSNGT